MKEFKYFMKKKQMQFIELKNSIAIFILNTMKILTYTIITLFITNLSLFVSLIRR